jgi:hypothetical protein
MIPLHVRYQDGTEVDLDARPFAIELWERETKQKMFGLAEGAGMGDLMRIAYHELKLSGETLGKYDEWASKVVSILEVEDPKEAAPPA